MTRPRCVQQMAPAAAAITLLVNGRTLSVPVSVSLEKIGSLDNRAIVSYSPNEPRLSYC